VTTKKAKTELVQITASPIPPTHQSTELLMGCKKNYATQVIEKRKNPGGVDSMRGREIHSTMALYLSHCAHKGVPMDMDAFDTFSKGAGALASKILVGIRDNYKIDFSHLFATEVTMHLDEEFNPTQVIELFDGTCSDSGKPIAYEGTLDGLFLYPEEYRILVDDFKSHPRPYSPADHDKGMQGKEYSLFCFMHFPWVQQVKFRLIFVRFNNVVREVTYTREDVPSLIDAVKSLRARHRFNHEDYAAVKDIEATGNDGCFYCPLLPSRECPILRDNPNAQGEPAEWLSSALAYSAYARVNNARMKAWVQANGRPIILRDYNEKAFTFGPVESTSDIYSLFKATETGVEEDGNRLVMPIVELLTDYAYAAPGDTKWMQKIQISSTSIKSYLKTKGRAVLDQAIDDIVEKVTKVKSTISKPLDSIPDHIITDEDEEEEF
jgi:hypothetical protein